MKKETQVLFLLLIFALQSELAQGQELNSVSLGSFTVVDQSVFDNSYRQSANYCKRVDRDGVNESVVREFRYHFLEANNLEWFALDGKNRSYVVYFWYNGNKGKAVYAKKTGLQYAIVHVPENNLTQNDREALKLYSGYTINNVMETTAEGQTFLVVKLRKKNHAVLVKLQYGIMTELQDWSEPETDSRVLEDKQQLVAQKKD
jgi:hypothetical protein